MLIDLDNTLTDRASAFARWAAKYVRIIGGGATDVDWLVAMDRDGLEPRTLLAAAVVSRFGLDADGSATIRDHLARGMAEEIELDPQIPVALEEARSVGWSVVVVTNGPVAQQRSKLVLTGLLDHVDGVVISEGVGFRKPDPEMFQLAAAEVGLSLDGAWMIGDSIESDVLGAQALGLRTAWLHRGRPWPSTRPPATLVADSCCEAIRAVVSSA